MVRYATAHASARVLSQVSPSSTGHHGSHVKRALAVLRRTEGSQVAGAAFALAVEGQVLLATTASVARLLQAGEVRFVGEAAGRVLATDDEHDLALLEAPALLEPLRRLAVAPLGDGDEVLVTGPGLTLATGSQSRHLWITRRAVVAGRMHGFSGEERLEEFSYLLDIGHPLPAGSLAWRPGDGAVVGVLADASQAPSPGLAVVRPVRDLVALADRSSG